MDNGEIRAIFERTVTADMWMPYQGRKEPNHE
jgi:hypothetical protein